MNIGEKLKILRINENKTINQIADILGVAKVTYDHYETGEKTIPLERLNDLCNYYTVSIDYIFGLTRKLNYKNLNNNIDKKIVGSRLKEFRKENKLTQVKLASILNTVHPTIVNYENGKNLILTLFLYEICHKYKISADYLLGKINEPKYLK